jgi:hypothetical protein
MNLGETGSGNVEWTDLTQRSDGIGTEETSLAWSFF